MPRRLAVTLKVVDLAMLGYWLVAALACFGLVMLPADMMYAGYGDPLIDAWNWSFAPLDLAFSLLGLIGLRLARLGDRRWLPVTQVSLGLTFCAGLMALSFWALRGEFDLAWWVPNLALVAIGGGWGWRLIGQVR